MIVHTNFSDVDLNFQQDFSTWWGEISGGRASSSCRHKVEEFPGRGSVSMTSFQGERFLMVLNDASEAM